MTILGRGDWTKEHHALIDGKANVDVYVKWREEIFFQYQGREPQPAKTKCYRVADPQVFQDALEKHTPGDSGLLPGELLDENGNRFTVMQPGLNLFDDDPLPEAVGFPLHDFDVEIKTTDPGIMRIHPTTYLVMQFLAEYPNEGGSLEFIGWAKAHPNVKSVEKGGPITWIDPTGTPQVKETKSVTNRIGPVRKKRQRQ